MTWTLHEILPLCRDIESVAPAYGCHVALTGGLLYKLGERKDADLVMYRIRQVSAIDVDGLFLALVRFGIERVNDSEPRWCVKATHRGRTIDFFFPDYDGDYPPAVPVAEDPAATDLELEL